MTTVRVQRRRTKGWRAPADAVYVGRPSIWGNPYRVARDGRVTWHVYAFGGSTPIATFRSRTGHEARQFAVDRLQSLFDHHRDPWGKERVRAELAGLDLMCWCPLTDVNGVAVPCHADLLLAIANGGQR